MKARSAAKRWQLRGPEPAEHDIQVQVCRVLGIELAAPGHLSAHRVVWFCVDHAHFAGIPAARVGRGIIAGIPDVYLNWRGRAHWIELKRPGGVVSEAQQWLIPVLDASEARIGLACSAFEVLGLLDAWEIPRRGLIKDAA